MLLVILTMLRITTALLFLASVLELNVNLFINSVCMQFDNQDYYTAEFTKDKMKYFDIKDEKSFFSDPERSRIVS